MKENKISSEKIQNCLECSPALCRTDYAWYKKIEYRTISTNIRGRVYIYASKQPRIDAYEKMKVEAGTFPAGVIVGTVEIIGCIEKKGEYQWLLANPNRLKKMIVPENRPNPVWFKPFK